MYIRLTRKFCDVLNGLDLRPFSVGQIIDLKESLAVMLIAEGCAEPVSVDPMDTADDRSPARSRKPPVEPA